MDDSPVKCRKCAQEAQGRYLQGGFEERGDEGEGKERGGKSYGEGFGAPKTW